MGSGAKAATRSGSTKKNSSPGPETNLAQKQGAGDPGSTARSHLHTKLLSQNCHHIETMRRDNDFALFVVNNIFFWRVQQDDSCPIILPDHGLVQVICPFCQDVSSFLKTVILLLPKATHKSAILRSVSFLSHSC